MKILIVCTLIFIADSRWPTDEEWDAFKEKFGKTYINDGEEGSYQTAFSKMLTVVEGYNKLYYQGKVSFRCEINKYSDGGEDEMGLLANSLSDQTEYETPNNYIVYDTSLDSCFEKCIPKSWSWVRRFRILDIVYDQSEKCGACYAFATVGAIEANNFIHNGMRFIKLSEQQLVDCSESFGNEKCYAGSVTKAYNYYISDITLEDDGTPRKPRGAMASDDYEYIAKINDDCYYNRSQAKVFLKHYMAIPPNENSLKIALAKYGPITVGIFADLISFIVYRSGIYDDPHCRSDKNTHAVLLVGYGSRYGKDYWIIKNSWGRDWGENGYAKILRNGKNFCGILNNPILPVIAKRKNPLRRVTEYIPETIRNCNCSKRIN